MNISSAIVGNVNNKVTDRETNRDENITFAVWKRYLAGCIYHAKIP